MAVELLLDCRGVDTGGYKGIYTPPPKNSDHVLMYIHFQAKMFCLSMLIELLRL